MRGVETAAPGDCAPAWAQTISVMPPKWFAKQMERPQQPMTNTRICSHWFRGMFVRGVGFSLDHLKFRGDRDWVKDMKIAQIEFAFCVVYFRISHVPA
jgi:hypothetical protein